MIPLPKPRGFWDYALFGLIMTGALAFMFRLNASDGIGWPDAALALAAAVLFVFAAILARRGERATWIVHPTWKVHLLIALGAFVLFFGAIYADTYLLHPRDITSNRHSHDVVIVLVGTAWTVWSSRRRLSAKRQLL